MANKNEKSQVATNNQNNQIDLNVIDQFYSAQLSANESKERMDALRVEVEIAVKYPDSESIKAGFTIAVMK